MKQVFSPELSEASAAIPRCWSTHSPPAACPSSANGSTVPRLLRPKPWVLSLIPYIPVPPHPICQQVLPTLFLHQLCLLSPWYVSGTAMDFPASLPAVCLPPLLSSTVLSPASSFRNRLPWEFSAACLRLLPGVSFTLLFQLLDGCPALWKFLLDGSGPALSLALT